jgi:hypothetical protein
MRDRDDVGERHLIHIWQGIARTMKYKWNQRQWFAEAKRHTTFHQLPFRFFAAVVGGLLLFPDFDDVACATFRQRFEFQDTNGFSLIHDEWIFSVRPCHQFTERHECHHVAAIDALRLPVEDVFSSVADDISTGFTIGLPIDQSATAA